MSLFKSKHSGWTWDLKRTPFGGGGGFISAITDPISSALGTDGGGGGLLGGLASIDPGPMLGGTLAGLDKFVGNEIPGGWATVGALGAGGAGLVFAPEIAAAIESAGLSSEAASLTPEMVNFANASADPIGTISAISGMTPEEFAAATKVIGDAGAASSLTAGEDLAQLMASHPDLSAQQLQDIMAINYGADPTVAADAANLAANGYDANTINQVLSYSYSPTELSGTGIDSLALDSSTAGLNAKDVLTNVNRARQLANLLNSAGGLGKGIIKASAIPSSQDWLKNAQTVALNQPAQQQFGGLYQMNKSPFTFQNPTAALLAGGNKTPAGLDVSGQQGTSLNTQQQNQIFSSLLRS
jgi:hypothetical protein